MPSAAGGRRGSNSAAAGVGQSGGPGKKDDYRGDFRKSETGESDEDADELPFCIVSRCASRPRYVACSSRCGVGAGVAWSGLPLDARAGITGKMAATYRMPIE